MDYSRPGLLVDHHLPELAQTHVHQVGDAIQPSYPVTPFSSYAIEETSLDLSIFIKVIVYCVQRHSFVSDLVARPAEPLGCSCIPNYTLLSVSQCPRKKDLCLGCQS